MIDVTIELIFGGTSSDITTTDGLHTVTRVYSGGNVAVIPDSQEVIKYYEFVFRGIASGNA